MALCDSMYPRKLIFCYLQDLHKEFVKLEDVGLTESIMRPYSFVKFGNYIPVAAINYRKNWDIAYFRRKISHDDILI